MREAPQRQMLELQIDQALGRKHADLVVRNARILNVVNGEIQSGDIAICGNTIVGTLDSYRGAEEIDAQGRFVVPGFIDSHVHCESTLVTPGEFDRCVLPHGVTTAVCDPHEICNVLGLTGLKYFLDCALNAAIDLRVQLSSCVPATNLETSGARLAAADLVPQANHPQVIGLAEFMNVPGVLNKDPECMEKLAAFYGRHIDGHAPLLSNHALNAYLSCGIRNCHETTNLSEGREKLSKGMQVLIREGSVSKDLAALAPLITEFASPFLGFCTDDRNPLDIHEEGHLDHMVRRAIALGAPVAAVYRVASWSAARGFGLTDRGLIAPGYLADFLLLDDLETCAIHSVFRRGRIVEAETFAGRTIPEPPGGNTIKLPPMDADSFAVHASGASTPVIGIIPGKILTERLQADLPWRNGQRHSDPERDLLKLCVLERHGRNGNIGRGFVKGFGFHSGALASSVGHDSHNLCVVGASDPDMAMAANRLRELGGGFVAVQDGRILAELALPFAGLMSLQPFESVRRDLYRLRAAVREMGCTLSEPFLHLAFLPLPVIPHLKITDFGLVDVDRFELIPG
ncbi:MAG: adenine deaminase [Silvibacterium sp.]|nr:adenine deaminase [Silvibacterium sp.]